MRKHPALLALCSAANVHADLLARLPLLFQETRPSNPSRNGDLSMDSEPTTPTTATPSLNAAQVCSMAVLCLVVGLGIGYLMRSSQLAVKPPQTTAHAGLQTTAGPHHPTLEQLQQIADKKAAPLLEKLKSNPNDPSLLVQVAAIYHTSHRFKEAADCYSKVLESDPRNVAIRTKLASSLYRNGDVDGAITQLNQALVYEPKDANALFDLGMIKLQGKSDGKGAIASWQRLLKTNPQLSPDRKATVMKLMADVMTMMGDQHGIEKPRSNDEHQ
jgi:cytochrome c-type biogenesis protein CcmH/NrfG